MVLDVMLSILLRFKQTLIMTLSSLLLILHNSSHGIHNSRLWRMEFTIVLLHMEHSYTDETWYDSVAVLEFECSDEDFQNVLSLNDSEVASRPSNEIRSKSDESYNETNLFTLMKCHLPLMKMLEWIMVGI
ncbi:hypothetical protein L1987_55201 [Smallanthus sonchifolius]|uniref:Uncharacterized protein n=1 Tax=Smallanthus sonchifolius TaxID=185202 RepID=A0ACB9E9W9_9ASTR|nr:hypothetical protein L1987_55201 [Smallanthus sonchifolius]